MKRTTTYCDFCQIELDPTRRQRLKGLHNRMLTLIKIVQRGPKEEGTWVDYPSEYTDICARCAEAVMGYIDDIRKGKGYGTCSS